MTVILAIDPAKPQRSRGFACYETARAVFLPRGKWRDVEFVVCEGQWANPKASRQSLMTLSFYAGWLLGSACTLPAMRPCVIPVADWKGALIPGFANAPKAVYSANIRQLLERAKQPLPKSDHDLDAMGIALACAKMLARDPNALAPYEVK